MNNLKTKNVNKLAWRKSYRSWWYALNGVSYPFTIKTCRTDCPVDQMYHGHYHLYFGNDYVDKFDTLQKAKNHAEGINNKQEVA